MRRRIELLSFLLLLLSAVARVAVGQAPAVPQSGKVRSEMLVSSAWLAQHLKDPKVVVLHIAAMKNDYLRGHIPGARFLNENDYIEPHTGAMTELSPVEKLTKTFSDLGITDDTLVVLYTTDWFPQAARGYYTLDYLGHEKTALLDGGIEHWMNESRPVTSEVPKFSPAKFTPHVRPEVRAELADVRPIAEEKTDDPKVQFLDARPARRYAAGHLAGAANLYWQDTLVSEDDPVFLPVEKLRELYAARGIAPGKKIVTYCEVGIQASHGYFLAKYLGYGAAMYDGSFYEWNEMEKLPVVKGDAKR